MFVYLFSPGRCEEETSFTRGQNDSIPVPFSDHKTITPCCRLIVVLSGAISISLLSHWKALVCRHVNWNLYSTEKLQLNLAIISHQMIILLTPPRMSFQSVNLQLSALKVNSYLFLCPWTFRLSVQLVEDKYRYRRHTARHKPQRCWNVMRLVKGTTV